MKMTIDTLTLEEHERTGQDLVAKLPEDNNFKYHYGTWAFTSEEGNSAERHLMKAGTPAAWKSLGKLYEQTATFTEEHGGSEFISPHGNCESRDLLAYWAIRAYLKAGKEDEAIATLNRFAEHKEVAMPQSFTQKLLGRITKRDLPSLNLIYSLVNNEILLLKSSMLGIIPNV